MIIGFTGTREALSQDQLRWLELALRSSTREVIHHGCCVGADAVIHRLAILYGFQVVLHPPADLRLADTEAIGNARKAIKRGASHCVLMPAKPYLERNRDIVDACDLLIAMPRNARPRGGTWYTVGYAESQGKSILCCPPSGRVQKLGKWHDDELLEANE